MGTDRHCEAPWDDDGDGDLNHCSHIDALDVYAESEDEADDWVLTLLFTATNPARTVSVTSSMDGRPLSIELAPQVTRMSEQQLSDEIAMLATLSRQQSRAAHHVLVAELMQKLGNDPVVTRGFLEHDLGLPSPDTVRAERARAFASRYAVDDE